MEILDKKINVDPKAKGLIFDLDGTVADTMPLHYEAWNDIVLEKGLEYPRALFNEFAGMPTRNIIPIVNERLNIDLDVEKSLLKKEKLFLSKLHKVKVIKEIADIIYEFHNKLPISLGTGGRRHVADLTLKAINFEKYFNIIVSADDVEKHKPEPDTFLKCAEMMGVYPEYCQVFEDGEQGLIAAERAGMIVTDVRPYLS